jgi:hypothetical protein
MDKRYDPRPDMTCVPYRRKGLYLALTIPIVLIVAAVIVTLATFSVLLSIIVVLLYLSMSIFQAYCCAYQGCPYVGGFCPGVMGILPASLLAQLLYGGGEIVRSRERFQRHAILTCVSWLGVILFPLTWLVRLGAGFAAVYVLSHLAYTLAFWLTICPACAIRDICPGGRLHRELRIRE